MTKTKAFFKANKFLVESFRNYRKFSTKSEKAFDIYIAFFISLLFVIAAAYFSDIKVKEFIANFQSLNNIVITAISILAGFNMASIAVISSSQSDMINRLKETRSSIDPSISKFSVLIIFFTWAISIQLTIVLFGILLHFCSQFLIQPYLLKFVVPIWLWAILVIWMSIFMHSIFISIRNVKMLFLFVSKGLQDE
ncbi:MULTISPECIES: hypothetical protein [Bacillus]|uniref:hypothetical protein n=1 Tax=Bacillus TaxID=1386 RepID=UPI000BF7899C|nr:hypothetical protein [Bacillus thuringiensis]PFC31693.1 hypothetical protein CN299_12120 [Bacillus thuringiensis]